MSKTEPLLCPFCGGQLRRNMCGSFEDDNKGCILYGFEIHEKMIPMWNTRKPMEKIVERLEDMAAHYAYDPSVDGAVKAIDYLYAVTIVKEEGGLSE